MNHAAEILSLGEELKVLYESIKIKRDARSQRLELLVEEMQQQGLTKFTFEGHTFQLKNTDKKLRMKPEEKYNQMIETLEENGFSVPQDVVEKLLRFVPDVESTSRIVIK